MPYTYLIIAVLLFNLFFFIGIFIGFLIGQRSGYSINESIDYRTNRYSNAKQKINKPQIDETKFVTRIDTDNLEKKYKDIGQTKESTENIESSISKLKSLKG
jgi:hypothetical protein